MSFSLPQVLLLVFLTLLFITTVYSVMLVYHWHAYGENIKVNRRTTTVYLIGVLCSLAGMGIAYLAVI